MKTALVMCLCAAVLPLTAGCDSMKQPDHSTSMQAQLSLYTRLGGEPAIKAVVDDFVARAAGDPKVNFTRVGTAMAWNPSESNVAHLKLGLVNLIGQLTGGPQKYTGRDMKTVHRGMMITDAEFNALAADLAASLDKFNVPAKEKGELMTIVAGTRGDIVERLN